jgi:hypothetical protein
MPRSHRYASVGRRADTDADTFRRLVSKEITADDYVRSLERRVRERHAEESREEREEPSVSEDA